ncbi:predicted protein [Chaetoceros tenuissimus]|uniref:Uncharacterized protein n=1 Tax=Chaetoceros tenuissimus TaxID=426638 RepID=A0AAD3HAE9_9STRA|nr:predicted protein [Chaetoceros tenuissimus]
MKSTFLIAFLLQLTSASAATTKVLQKRSEEKGTRSLSDFNQHRSLVSLGQRISKQKEFDAIAKNLITANDYVPPATRNGSDSSYQCFFDTVAFYLNDYPMDFDDYYEVIFTHCDDEWNCDFSTVEVPGCEENGGVVERVTLTFCPDEYFPFTSTHVNRPYCVAPSCGGENFRDIFLEYYAPLVYYVGLGDSPSYDYFGTYWDFLNFNGFATCPATPSSKAPKSSKSPSSKQPKSSRVPSSKMPKSSKVPSSKAPKSSKSPSTPSSKAPKATKSPKATAAPSSKAPKGSTKSPKSTKSPGAAASSSGSTMQNTVAATAAAAITLFAL